MAALELTADLLESADDQMEVITQKLHRIISESVEISSFTLTDPRLVSDLKEMDVTLQSEIKKISEQISEEPSGATSAVSLCQVLHHSVCHLEQLRQQLQRVQSAVQGLDRFLATMREVKAEIPTLQANQHPDWEQERRCWRAALMQRLHTAAELSDSVDSSLKAAGVTVTMGGAAVTCQDVVRSLSRDVVDGEKELMKASKREMEQRNEAAQEQEEAPCSGVEEESPLEAKRSGLYGENSVKQSPQTCRWDVKDQRRRAKIQLEGQKEILLLGAMGEIRRAAEHLGLQEPTLPALQHRSRVLTQLESRLAGILAELHVTHDASSGGLDASQAREVEDLWEETAAAVSERLEQCRTLTELLKRFQSLGGDLSGTLLRAESTIRQQSSYMSKDNLQRTHSKVEGTKVQLNGLVGHMEELRSVCRQLDTHLRHFPQCTFVPFESEAAGLMDQWLDISERTDSHLDNLHLALILWDGLLRLGADVENWTTNKLAVFAESPSFQTESDIHTLQDELVSQEESIERFHRKAADIQSLLQTSELPLQLQMLGTQMKKKVEELKEVVCEAEDVYRQMVDAKGQVSMRLQKCLDCLQKIQDSLLTVSGSDATTVRTKLEEQCFLLQTQEEQAESLLDDLQVLASIASPDSLQKLFGEAVWLQEKARNTRRLLSEVHGRTEKNIQDLGRLHTEKQQLEQWLQTAEDKSAKEEHLQEEALVRTTIIRQLVSSLQASSLQEATLVEESHNLLERYHSLLSGSTDRHTSAERDAGRLQTLCRTSASDGQLVDSPFGERIWVQSPAEQKLQHTHAVVGARAEGQMQTENSLKQGFCDGDGLKTTEQHWGDVVQPDEPYYRFPQPAPEFTSSHQAQRQEAHGRVEPLTCQIAELPTLFPGRAECRQAYNRSCQLGNEAESLQLALITPAQQRRELAEESEDGMWKTWDMLEDDWSGMMAELKGVCSRLEEGVSNEECFGRLLQDCHHKLTTLQQRMSACQAQKEASVGLLTDLPAVEDSLQEVADVEKDLLQGVKDSMAVSPTAEADPSCCHKGAVGSSVRDQQRLQQVKREASCAHTALTDLTEDLRKFCGKQPELPDIKKLKQLWFVMQVSDARLTELAARVDHLHKCGESSITQEMIPADVVLTLDTVSKDLSSLRKILLQKMQECSEATATWMRQIIVQLHQWSQMVQTEPSVPSQLVLDQGLLCQQCLHEVLSEKDVLLKCLGTEAAKTLEKCASHALSESTSALHTLSERQAVETFRSEGDAGRSAWPEETTRPPASALPPAADNKKSSDHDQKHKGALNTARQETRASTEPGTSSHVAADATEQDPARASVQLADTSVTCDAGRIRQHVPESLQQGNTDSDVTSLAGSVPRKPDQLTLFTEQLSAEADVNKDAQEQEEMFEAVGPKSMVTIILNMEPQDLQESVDPHVAEFCNAAPTEVEANECEDTSERHKKVFTIVLELEPQRDNAGAAASHLVGRSDGAEVRDEDPEEPLSSSTSRHTQCQLSGVSAAQTTLPHVRREQGTDSCHRQRSASSPAEDEEPTGNARTETPALARDGKQMAAGTSVPSSGRGQAEGRDLDGPEGRRDQDEGESKLLSLQRVVRGSMEPQRTAEGSTADPGAAETTDDSPGACKRRRTMQETWPESQRSKVINRPPGVDLNRYLPSPPGELEVRLVRTVQQVLACRYQAARLDVRAMAKQLTEAEELSAGVQEQVAAMKSRTGASVWDSDLLRRAEEQWSAALLDASATVQVKAAQLEQVKQYHRQMKMTRAFLEVLAAEEERMSTDALGSSSVQADKLCVLMQTMNEKRAAMEELPHLSSQLSVHLSDAERSGALVAWLGDVQEQWRLLEGRVRRALQHASHASSHFSVLTKEVEQLRAKLEALQKASCQSSESKSDLELVCLTTDLKLYNQLYVQVKPQLEALVHFSLGQKEADELRQNFQELGSLLSVTTEILGTSAYGCGSSSSGNNKQLRDLIIWAKQAENHISIGKRLALFPEEARVQIAEMKKFQTDILSRRSKMQDQVEEMKALSSDMKKEEGDQVMKTIEDLYEAIADSLDHVLDTMKANLQEREKLLSQLSHTDAWLADTHAVTDLCGYGHHAAVADVQTLESEVQRHQAAMAEITSRLGLLEEMAESCKKLVAGLSPGESRYLVNRLSGLWTELNGLLCHETSASWELEELIHARTASEVELCAVQAGLKLIACDLEQHSFPLTHESLSTIACLKHMLMEHRCQAQELQHCQEGRRRALLHAIGDLQDRCRALSVTALEQMKYQYLRRQMEESMDVVTAQIHGVKDELLSVDERFTLCQTLLVGLPMVRTQCQEARDQLEVIAQGLHPCELNSERQRMNSAVGTLVSWEHSVSADIKNMEAKLLPCLHLSSELPAVIELFQRTRAELEAAEPVGPDLGAIDAALQRYWGVWRRMESGMRVLEALGQRDKVDLENYEELCSLRDAATQMCRGQMERLSQAQESLKHYLWAARGALGFLRNAEATFLSAAGRFLDCAEEHRQTQQALQILEGGFQAHMCHLGELVPQHPCLSQPHVEQLHVGVLGELVAGRAILQAQAQLQLEALQRCAVRQQSHRVCHQELQQRLTECEARLAECAATPVTSYDKCSAQLETAVLLMEDLHSLAGKLEELQAGCPNQGCGAGEDAAAGALWRRWVTSRRHVGLLMAHTQQKGQEWKDIAACMEQCGSFLARLQTEALDSSRVSFSHVDPQELLAQAEMHHAGLEQAQQAVASVTHRLEHALTLSTSHSTDAGPAGETLKKIQENIRSLRERNLLLVAAAQTEETERRRVQEEMREVENHMFNILLALEACSNPSKQQELEMDLCSNKNKLKCITEGVRSRYAVIPADISRRLQEAELSQQRAEEKLKVSSSLVHKVAGRVMELVSGLENVKGLLEQRSPTVSEAQNVLKCVWDKLDVWHSRLMLLESEVQDVAEEQPDQGLLLMDQLTQPLQLYQNTAQMAEQRTSFLSKIPACLQELEDILYSATCWLDEAQSWLDTHCAFTTARSLQNHANSLQLVLDDSERIRDNLRGFGSVLAEIAAVCDISTDEERLAQNDQRVCEMQRSILEPLEQVLQAAEVVEAVESELKTMEKNIPKIRAILSSMEKSDMALMQHLHNRQVILANVQAMQRTLTDMETCRGELRLPQGGEKNLTVFSRAQLLRQQLGELKQATEPQASVLEEASVSEEEEEDDESCHSSSSDTLTGSVPEDPEETLKASEDVSETKLQSDAEELRDSPPEFPSDMETSSERAEAAVRPVKSACDATDAGSKTEVVAFSLGPLFPADPAATDRFPAADALEQREALVSVLAAAAGLGLESTRLIPARPITPFTATTSVEFIEGDEDPSTAADNDAAMPESKEQLEVDTSCRRLEESHTAADSSKDPISSADREDHEEQRSWSRLYSLISQKLTTLKKVQEQRQTDGEIDTRDLVPSGSVSAALQQTHKSIVMLRQTVSSAGPSPGVKERSHQAVEALLLCLDSLTRLLSASRAPGEVDAQLQQECVLNELVSLWELLVRTQGELVREEPDAVHCLTCLQDCLGTVQLLVTSTHDRQLPSWHQGFSSNPLCILEEFDVEEREIFPSLKSGWSLEQCVLGRHLRDGPGEKARLQQASWSLLQGIIRLLDLGEECKTVQMSQVHNLGQHQASLCGHKKLLQVLGSQLAFVQHLFQCEPEALKCQEDDRVQLEVRARALQHRALEQEVAFQTRLQEWSRWEDNCGQLGRELDELEALISSGEPERDDEECIRQQRLDSCQQTLVRLDESRAAVGLFRDQWGVMLLLQTEPVSWAGSALELRWRSVCTRTEQEVRRCRDMQDSWTRFQTDVGSVSGWLVGANKHLKAWSDLADSSDLKQDCVHRRLIELLDFSMEVEAVSLQKASVSREGTKLIHLRERDSPRLRAQLAQLDVSWSRLTSDLSKVQDQLQQLVAVWPPVQLLSDLDEWLKKREARLNAEKETVLKVEDDAHIHQVLLRLKELKAGVVSGKSLLDFLSQSGPQVLGAEVQSLRSERTLFAERLGGLRLQWMDFEKDVESQICRVEQMHHICANGEKQLTRLRASIARRKEQLNKLQHLTGQTQLRKALEEWEAAEAGVKDVAAALQQLKTTRVDVDREELHPCDAALCIQADGLIVACQDLCRQMESLKAGLEQTLRAWTGYDRDLREVCLLCTRVRCELQHQRAPLLSLTQTQGHMLRLQQLEEKTGSGDELWATVKASYQGLMKSLHCGTAQALSDRMDRERGRWDHVVQQVKDELTQTAETLSLWRRYRHLSESCSLHLQSLWRRWEEPSASGGAQASLQNLQDAAEILQRSLGDVLVASQPLVDLLDPLASHAIRAETGRVSRDVLLLSRAISSLQENVDEQRLFNTRLEALDMQLQSIQPKMEAGFAETDSAQQVLLELSALFVSLLDVRAMSGYVALNNQEMERLQRLSREWVESMTRTCDTNRTLLAANLVSQSFEQKHKKLASIGEKLERALSSAGAQSCCRLPEMLRAQQRLQADVMTGHQLLQSLLCDAVSLMEAQTGQKRSELVARVSAVKRSWSRAAALTERRTRLLRQQLGLWWTCRRGVKLLRKLLGDVEPLLPAPGSAPCAPLQLWSRADDEQRVEEALRLHRAVYTQTLEAGRRLYQTMAEVESRSQLQSESRAIKEAWEGTASLLEGRTDAARTTVQTWSQCQDAVSRAASELDELRTRLEPQSASVQEAELFLQRLNTGLRDLDAMKTDLVQRVAPGDSAPLEQQLEQLHAQWDELSAKVSSRRQEVADRLDAWTIFNGKSKEFCDWLSQMESKVCHSGDRSIGEMVEKLTKDCMEEINLFSENKRHLKQLGEQLLLASDEAKQTRVRGSLQEVNQRWHGLLHHVEARVKKLKETLVTVQQLDENMSRLRSWLSRVEAELSRPITYSVCHHQEIQRRLAEQQELQKDIEQHTDGVASVLSLCDVLLRDEDVAGGSEVESESLQETSRSLDQRWRSICALALERRLRIEETWRLWCKFLEDYSRFEDWLNAAERTAADANSADVPYAAAKEELKRFEGFQRQVHERLTQLELLNNQYRRLARENRTDRASRLKATVHEGNRRWDALHRRVAAVLRRLKHFTGQREEFEGTRENMLVWLTELDLQLTNVEHFSESDVHHKMQQLNSFQKEISLNTERIDGLIVFGESLIQKSSPQDAALIEDELEELHSYCQEVFSRLVRFHQRLSQPPVSPGPPPVEAFMASSPQMLREEPDFSTAAFALESSLELIGRPRLGLPATPTHLPERLGRETPLSVDSLALEWDPSGDVGGSSSHEEEEEGAFFSALSVGRDSAGWSSAGDTEPEVVQPEAGAASTGAPLQQGYLRLMSQCSGSVENFKRVSLILDDEDQPEELGLTGLTATDKQSGVIERWELLQARPGSHGQAGPRQPASDLADLALWLESVASELDRLQRTEPAASVQALEAKAKELKEMQKTFTRYKALMLSVNLRGQVDPEVQENLGHVNRGWSRACTGLQRWDTSLRTTLMRCQEFHESLHGLLLWLAHAESRRYAVDIGDAATAGGALRRHRRTLADLQEELRGRRAQQASLQALWAQLQPREASEEGDEAQEKLHVTGRKLELLLEEVAQDLCHVRRRLECDAGGQRSSSDSPEAASQSRRERRPSSFLHRLFRAAFPLHLLLLLLLLLPCLVPLAESDPGCTVTNNFARSFYPMLHYTNGPPPT